MSSSSLRALGLMSGTSVDGVDAALIETDGERVASFGPFVTVPYATMCGGSSGSVWRRKVRRGDHCRRAGGDGRPHRAVRRWSEVSDTALSTLDVVGFHGQTITHRPERRFTWQIGDGAALAHAIGVRVVSDLRGADVQAGGQGAPLVPVYHAALAHDLPRPLAVVNVGGVANVTWIGSDGALLAFDTGPGNAPIDDCVPGARACLRYGRRARRIGKVIAPALSVSANTDTLQSNRPSRSTAATSTTRGSMI